MHRLLLRNIAAVMMVVASTVINADNRVIHAGMLLAVPGEKPLTAHTIVVKDGKIVDLLQGYADAHQFGSNAKLIDLKDSFVLPGLMDAHVHLQIDFGPKMAVDKLKMSSQLAQMRSAHHAKNTLLAGFTTVRDTGPVEGAQEMYALRDAIAKGWLDGPRIIASEIIVVTGGHRGEIAMRHDFKDLLDSKGDNTCDGPYDCRRVARKAITYGADWVKISATGGVATERATGTGQQMDSDEIREIVNASHRMGRKVTAHAHQEDGIIAALEAGVDCIEHGSFAGPRSIKLFKKTGAYLVPTLLAGHLLGEMAAKNDTLPAPIREKARKVGSQMMKNFAKLHKAGVKLAYGTDTAMMHGINAREAVLMHRAGMSEMEIIKTATINTAELLDLSDSLGTIEVGKEADIIATDASPLKNIEELLDVDFVMKAGKVYKH
ncbi:amidohydrolase family protein [Pseudomaricurvus alkylphenolicus]|uniref:amidohydrolase family protein n=1 Tax=Pseudomaricurvus alkylphenolicus TaxID=1306991 RepID=UPI0030B86C17